MLVFDNNTLDHLTVRKQMSPYLFKMLPTNYSFKSYMHFIYICINKI